jgi:hypothetical protein
MDKGSTQGYRECSAQRMLFLSVLFVSNIQPVPGLIVGKDFAEIVRAADAIVVARVRTVEAPVSEAPPNQVRKSEGLIPVKYDYRVRIMEVLKGDIVGNEMNISFYYREHLKASRVETGSGLEFQLRPGDRYILLLQKMSDSRYEFIRAEEYEKKEEILRIEQGPTGSEKNGPQPK